MLKLIHLIFRFTGCYFHPKLFGCIGIFLSLFTLLEYQYSIYDTIIAPLIGNPIRIPLMFIHQVTPFLVTCTFISLFTKKKSWIKSKTFWLKVIAGFSIVSIGRSLYIPWHFLLDFNEVDEHFIKQIFRQIDGLLIIVAPLLLIHIFLEKPYFKGYYGLRSEENHVKPYLYMLLIMVFGVGLGFKIGDLNEFYPVYQRSGGDEFALQNDLSRFITIITFELAYAIDFFWVELFFRGFLVLAFTRWFGGHAVLIMVSTYVFAHYGKPLTEIIGSCFGAYILGILTYHTRSVWTGIVLHIGIAWISELFGFFNLADIFLNN